MFLLNQQTMMNKPVFITIYVTTTCSTMSELQTNLQKLQTYFRNGKPSRKLEHCTTAFFALIVIGRKELLFLTAKCWYSAFSTVPFARVLSHTHKHMNIMYCIAYTWGMKQQRQESEWQLIGRTSSLGTKQWRKLDMENWKMGEKK